MDGTGLSSCACEAGVTNRTAESWGGATVSTPGLTRSVARPPGEIKECGCGDAGRCSGPAGISGRGLSTREVAPGLHRPRRAAGPMADALGGGMPDLQRRQRGLHTSAKAALLGVPQVVTPPLRYVDIYLSAGPHENYGVPAPPDYRSCNPDNTANCSLYRLRWDHLTNTGVVERVEAAEHLVIGGGQLDVGYVQPAVSPDGRHILYVGVDSWQDASARRGLASSLRLKRGIHRTGTTVFFRAAGADQPQYPAWITNAVDEPSGIFGADSGTPYLWNSSTGALATDTSTVWKHTDAWRLDLDVPHLGPGGLVSGTQQTSFEDGNVNQDVLDRGGPGLVTFGGAVAPPNATERIPQVSDLDGSNRVQVDIASTTPALTECHHPAFAPEGDALLCTGQEPAEAFGLYDGSITQRRRRLHAFSWNGAAWANGAPLVGALSPSDFATIATDTSGTVLPTAFPAQTADPSSGECRNYVWKFAEYCGTARYVVATVYCTDTGDKLSGYRQILNSRVVLIDLDADDDTTGTPSAYHDLTSWIEDFEQAAPGSFNGAFSTCHRAMVAP